MNCLPRDWDNRAASVVVERENNNGNFGGSGASSNGNYNGSGVVIFADCNFGGNNRTYGPGAYNTEQFAGVGNDRVSSIQIPSDWQVIVYADGNWQGASKTYYVTSNCLESGWNNRISSMRIYSNTGNNSGWGNNNNNNNNNNSNDGATIFEDCYYGGRSYTLRPGRYDARQLGVGNDEISSIKVLSGYRITVYGDGGFSGGQRSSTRDVNCFGSDWNDKVSSVEVSRSSGNDYDYNHSGNDNNNELGVTLYEKSWFGGRSRTYGTGSFNFEDYEGLDRNVSSIKIEPGYTLTVWDEPGNRGNRYTFTASSGNLNFNGRNNRIRSISIRRNQQLLKKQYDMQKLIVRLSMLLCTLLVFVSVQAQTESPEATASIRKFLATKFSKEPEEGRKFMYVSVDLNDDGKNEYIVGMVGTSFCGSGGCTILVLTNAFKQNSAISVADYPIYIGAPGSKEVTKKYANIYVYSKGKGYVKLAWNGSKYNPSNASMAPKVSDDIKNGKTAFLQMPGTTTYTF